MLTSRYAMWMAWGRELTFFCNDAYLPTLGRQRSWALGTTRARFGRRFGRISVRGSIVSLRPGRRLGTRPFVISGTERLSGGDLPYVLLQSLWDDAGQISGMLCVVTEETERVIGERRLADAP